MKLYTALLSFILIQSISWFLEIKTLKMESNTAMIFKTLIYDSEKECQDSENDKKRLKNIKIIESSLKDQQNQGKLKDSPLFLINNKPFSYEDFKSRKDSIFILGEGEITQISIASPMAEKLIREKFDKPGEEGIMLIQILPDKK